MSSILAGEVSDPKVPSGEPKVTELNMAQKEGEQEASQDAVTLSLADKRRVRMMRFDKKNDEQIDTAAAARKILETKEKRQQRALKFGIETKEMEQAKKAERVARFGLDADEKARVEDK